MSVRKNSEKEEVQFRRAWELWDQGYHRRAFRLFLLAAKKGHLSSQLNIGYCYDVGVATKKNTQKAIYWYKRAYRGGNAGAANNIGTMLRDSKKFAHALKWFERALQMGDDGAAFEIAKIYLNHYADTSAAIRYLRTVVKSDRLDETTQNKARRLLMSAKKLKRE